MYLSQAKGSSHYMGLYTENEIITIGNIWRNSGLQSSEDDFNVSSSISVHARTHDFVSALWISIWTKHNLSITSRSWCIPQRLKSKILAYFAQPSCT